MPHIRLIRPEQHAVLALHTEEISRFIASDDIRKELAATSVDWTNLVKQGQEESLPEEHKLIWEVEGGNDFDRQVVLISRSSNLENALKIELPGSARSYPLRALLPDSCCYWQVRGIDADGAAAASEVFAFRTRNDIPRMIAVDGLTNVRDNGGWSTTDGRRTKFGLIYRGSEFDAHMELKAEGLQLLREELRVRTDLDLRGEAVGRIDRSPLGDDVAWKLIPVLAYNHIFNEEQGNAYRNIVETLADPNNYPVYIHCYGGADRTGTFFFMLNAVLGVPEAELVLDYELTSLSIFGKRSRNSELFTAFMSRLNPYDGETIQQKAKAFFRESGVTDEQLELLRSMLTE